MRESVSTARNPEIWQPPIPPFGVPYYFPHMIHGLTMHNTVHIALADNNTFIIFLLPDDERGTEPEKHADEISLGGIPGHQPSVDPFGTQPSSASEEAEKWQLKALDSPRRSLLKESAIGSSNCCFEHVSTKAG